MGDNDAFKRPEPLIPTEFSKKLSDLGRYDTWLGAGQAAVGVDPKAPGGALYTGPRPDAIPPADPLEQPDQGGGTNRTETDDENARLARELSFSSGGVGPTGPAPFYEKEGESYAAVGGKGLYDETFNQKTGGPARQAQARRDLADVQGERSGALAKFYAEQTERDTRAAAVMKQKAAEDQANIQARQQKLDEATQFYTNDLADQGKFWTNPGNIVSAIAFSMMPIFSNDPTVGAKLINQAIDRDMANRQEAARGTLGALQSNLHGYSKIAGDRQAGELLARAEAHRIAAQEIARIGAQFEGPIAQKQMALAIEDQQERQRATQMEAHKAMVHIEANRRDEGLHNARFIGGEDGYRPYGSPEAGGPPGNAVRGSIAGTPSTATTDRFSSPQAAARAHVAVKAGPTAVMSAADRGELRDKDLENAVKASMYAEGRRLYPKDQPDTAFQKVLGDARKELNGFNMEFAKKAPTRSMVGNLRTRMDIIERSERGEGKDPEAFITFARANWPTELYTQYTKLMSGDPNQGNKAEQRAALRKQAVDQFLGEFQTVINQNTHDMAGGSQTSMELANLAKEVSGLSTWRERKNYLERKDLALQSEVNAMKTGLTPAAALLLRFRTDTGRVNTPMQRRGQPEPVKEGPPVVEGQYNAPRSKPEKLQSGGD